MEKKKIDKLVLKYLFVTAALILGIKYFEQICGTASKLWHVSFSLILGCALAYILNLILKQVEKFYFPNSKNRTINKSRRVVCTFISIFLVFAIIVFIITLVVPELVNAFSVIGKGIPVYFELIKEWIMENSDQFPSIVEWVEGLQVDWSGMIKNLFSYTTSGVGGILNSTVSFVTVLTGGIMNFFIALIFAIYLLLSKEKLSAQIQLVMNTFIKKETMSRIQLVLSTADKTFSSFIIGQFTEAIILGTLCTIGMLICRFPYAPMIGTFIGATALIPIVGAYLGGGVGAFMILMVSPTKAILFIVFLVILQQLEGNLIYPKVVGSSIGLPGIWVLAAVTIGGGICGIMGMLLGVPIAATIYKLIKIRVDTDHLAKSSDGKFPDTKTDSKKQGLKEKRQ